MAGKFNSTAEALADTLARETLTRPQREWPVRDAMEAVFGRKLTEDVAWALWTDDKAAELCQQYLDDAARYGEHASDFVSWLAKRDWSVDALIDRAVATVRERRWQLHH